MSEWDREALARLHEAMSDSSMFLALLTDAWKEDPRCLLQLGYAIMLDKPIHLVMPKGTVIPKALRRVADSVEEFVGPEDYPLIIKRIAARAGVVEQEDDDDG